MLTFCYSEMRHCLTMTLSGWKGRLIDFDKDLRKGELRHKSKEGRATKACEEAEGSGEYRDSAQKLEEEARRKSEASRPFSPFALSDPFATVNFGK